MIAARDRARARRPAGAHHRQDERADRAADHRGALRGVAGGRADRPDRARHLRAAARHAAASRTTSACARSSAASSSTPASSTSSNGGEPEIVLRQRRLDGAQLLPPHRGLLPDPARQPPRRACCADLELYLADNSEAWELRADGSYARCTPGEPAAPVVRAARARSRRWPTERTGQLTRAAGNPRRAGARSPARDRPRSADARASQPFGKSRAPATRPRAASSIGGSARGLRPRCSSTARRSSTIRNARLSPRAAPASRSGSRSQLAPVAPTRTASSCCSSRGKPGMSAFSSR